MANAKVVSFLNMKGGVGKTTLCKEMGYNLATEHKKRILFIDVDPQANLTQSIFKRFGYKQKDETSSYDIEEGSEEKSLIICSASVNSVFNYSSFMDEMNIDDALLKINDYISIIPGDLNTLFLERSYGGSEKEHSLKNFIEDFNLLEEYDYIFLDCPPTYSFYTTAALLASDFYLSPIKPDSYSVLGLDLLQQAIEKLKKVHRERFRHRPINSLGVIFSNIPNLPSTGVSNLISTIKSSERLAQYDTYFFNDYFLQNATIPKNISYFINDGGSARSTTNLYNIIKEFNERMDSLWMELSSSGQN